MAASLISLAALQSFSAEDYGDPSYGEDPSALGSKESDIYVPPGMELRKMGSMNTIVPQGAQIRKQGSLMVMEGTDEYMTRHIYEMKSRISALEKRQAEFEKELGGLKQAASKTESISKK